MAEALDQIGAGDVLLGNRLESDLAAKGIKRYRCPQSGRTGRENVGRRCACLVAFSALDRIAVAVYGRHQQSDSRSQRYRDAVDSSLSVGGIEVSPWQEPSPET